MDKDSVYAMKKMNLKNVRAIHCALRERDILKRVALEAGQPPQIQLLFCSFLIYQSPVFVISKGNGFDFSERLTDSREHLFEHNALFYASKLT